MTLLRLLQSPLHRYLYVDCLRRDSSGDEENPPRVGYPRGCSESFDGQGNGHSNRVGRRD